MPATNNTRHAVSRSAGATTWTRKDGDTWKTTCLNHAAETTAPNRGAAWKNGSTPDQFCTEGKAIAAGKAEKLAVGPIDLIPLRRHDSARLPDRPGCRRPAGHRTHLRAR
jgi:hypothetical protein